jgi:hypothetical protein
MSYVEIINVMICFSMALMSSLRSVVFVPRNDVKTKFALRIEADTGLWLRPVQYERKAWPQATPKFSWQL